MFDEVYCSSTKLPYCCGVNDLGEYTLASGEEQAEELEGDGYRRIGADIHQSGTGLYTATFVHNARCDAAYEKMCEKYELLYRSPDFYNKNSGNDLFLCVFKDK